MEQLLEAVCRKGASDLIITVGTPAQMRYLGNLLAVDTDILQPEDTEQLCMSVLEEPQKRILKRKASIDFSKGFAGLSRFRFNIFRQRGSYAMAVRYISHVVPSFEELGLPTEIVGGLALRQQGLVLVTGAAGSGKSTTLAAMIDHINHHRHAHVICLEDPIEYLHHHNKCTIEQREILEDAPSFTAALHDVFRQSPDVIMVGEMRDMESIHLALTLAETGHLVLATLHTQDTVQAISRIVNAFPPGNQQETYTQLSMVLNGIISQNLMLAADGKRRVLCYEALIVTTAVRNLIRERQLQQIYSVIQTGAAEGMSSMNASLARMVRAGVLHRNAALAVSPRSGELERMLAVA